MGVLEGIQLLSKNPVQKLKCTRNPIGKDTLGDPRGQPPRAKRRAKEVDDCGKVGV